MHVIVFSPGEREYHSCKSFLHQGGKEGLYYVMLLIPGEEGVASSSPLSW